MDLFYVRLMYILKNTLYIYHNFYFCYFVKSLIKIKMRQCEECLLLASCLELMTYHFTVLLIPRSPLSPSLRISSHESWEHLLYLLPNFICTLLRLFIFANVWIVL